MILGVPYWIFPEGFTHDLSQNLKVSFWFNFKKRRRKDVWRCFSLLKIPKRVFIKTFILGCHIEFLKAFLSQNGKVSFWLYFFCQNRRKKRCLTKFRRQERPKKAFIKTFMLGLPYWIFLKGLSQHFEWKLESFFLIVVCQNRIRKDDWRCFKRLKRSKRECIKISFWGCHIFGFPKGLTHNFESKLESFVLIDFCQIE